MKPAGRTAQGHHPGARAPGGYLASVSGSWLLPPRVLPPAQAQEGKWVKGSATIGSVTLCKLLNMSMPQ